MNAQWPDEKCRKLNLINTYLYPSPEFVAKREGISKSATNIRNIRFYRTKKVKVSKTEFEIQLTYKSCIKPLLISKTSNNESTKKTYNSHT